MKRKTILLFLWLITLMNSASAQTVQSNLQVTEPAALSADHSEKAELLLRKSCDFYRSLKNMSGRLTTELTTKRNSEITQRLYEIGFEFERSKYLSIEILKPANGGVATLNGLDAMFYKPKWKSFANATVNSFDQVFQNQDFNFVTEGVLPDTLFRGLASDDPYAAIMKNRKIKSYDGITVIDGEKCHQLTLSTREMICDAHLWLSAGAKPWIKRYMPVRDCPLKILPVPSQPGPVIELTVNVVYSGMRDNQTVRKRGIKPASSAKRVTHLAASAAQDARQSLVGSRAPKVNISTIGNGKFNLSRARGKIVVLEFWATWCPPCCRALPILEYVTGEFPKTDVVFIAINEKEGFEKVRAFLKEKSLNPRVGLDVNGEVAQSFRVVGIPQTVVIGRDGKIASVHVGLTPEFKQEITKELQSLVSQKN